MYNIVNWGLYQACDQEKSHEKSHDEEQNGATKGATNGAKLKEVKKLRSKKAYCAEQAPAPPENDPVVLVYPLKTGEGWELRESKVQEYIQSFPHLDVRLELRKAWQWQTDNPHRRKTKSGITRSLNTWLLGARNGRHSEVPALVGSWEEIRRDPSDDDIADLAGDD